MGNLLSGGGALDAPVEGNGGSGSGPKSFYLVLGGPSIHYSRPGRGPLIFDVEPLQSNASDLIEHAEVVRPSVSFPSKQKIPLIPSPSGHASSSPKVRISFVIEYTKPPRSVHVLLDVGVEYRAGAGVVLHPNRGAQLRCVLNQQRFPTTSTAAAVNDAVATTATSSSGQVCGSGNATIAATISDVQEFSLEDLQPAPPKSELSAPCSLKACPIVVVVAFDGIVPPHLQPSRSESRTQGAAQRRGTTGGSDSEDVAPNDDYDDAEGGYDEVVPGPDFAPAVGNTDVSEQLSTTEYKLYTFLSFDPKSVVASSDAKKKAAAATLASGSGGAARAAHNAPPVEDEEMHAVPHATATIVKQLLEFCGEVYELEDIYDLGGDENIANTIPPSMTPTTADPTNGDGGGRAADDAETDDADGNECVICLTNPKNTTVIPCRHLCLCAECAVQLRHQSNKCPICRRNIDRLMIR